MKYEVRYLIGDEERTDVLDVDTAAEAAARVQEEHTGPDVSFELIQVQLIDENTDTTPVGAPAGARD
ncbi:MAG TPA: hypothetical protein VM450_02120 [Thermomicrobiales bacterium]|jgi:hypothetical protein|nr:hypothetical protein [Thermomicrobiales bacterium]